MHIKDFPQDEVTSDDLFLVWRDVSSKSRGCYIVKLPIERINYMLEKQDEMIESLNKRVDELTKRIELSQLAELSWKNVNIFYLMSARKPTPLGVG